MTLQDSVGMGHRRPVAALIVVAAGVVIILATSPGPVVTWLGLFLVGLLAGGLAGRASTVWPSVAVVAVAAAVAWWWTGGEDTHRIYWWLGVVIAALLVGIGLAIGTSIGWRRDPVVAARRWWHDRSRPVRWLTTGLVAVALIGLVGYTAGVAWLGSTTFTEAKSTFPDCRTPMQVAGIGYEAINYDQATDAGLSPVQVPDDHGELHWTCVAPPAPAGTEVVSSDGVHLAGWYVPAASGIGPTGPTVVVVPGWKANKSEILKYLPVFHDDANVVLMDVRNVGQSDRAATTLGLHERWDVRAMVDWLVATKQPSSIVLAADSMGAAASLAEAVEDPRIGGLILDSMHANLVVASGNILEAEHGQPSLPGSWAIAALTSLRVGGDVTSVDPVAMIERLGARPVLLTHGTADQVDRPAESAERNLHAAMAAGIPVELHYCPGSTHGKTLETCPAEWARWATSFLEGVAGS